MDTLAIADGLRNIKKLAQDLVTEASISKMTPAKIKFVADQIAAHADKILDVDMAYKPIPGSRAIGGS